MTIIRRLSVPKDHVPLFTRLAKMSAKDLKLMSGLLEQLPPTPSHSEVTERLQTVEEGVGLDGEDLLSALLALHSLHMTHGWAFEDIADTVSRSDRIDVDERAQGNLRTRLTELLRSRPLRELARATELSQECERLFHAARIITDVRPVFGDDPTLKPDSAIVFQTLRLEYFDTNDGQSRTFEVALTEGQVRSLANVCERAIAKAGAVRDFLGTAKVAEIDPRVGE